MNPNHAFNFWEDQPAKKALLQPNRSNQL